jgi:glycosyltransferase involved in cell wall biosynthesis
VATEHAHHARVLHAPSPYHIVPTRYSAAVRIVHFLNHTRRANGHVEIAVDLACAQASQGHEVAIVSGPGDFDRCLQDNGVIFEEIPGTQFTWRALTMAHSLSSFARRFRTDIVNAHMVSSALIARAVQPMARYRLVTTIHNSFDDQARLMRVGERVIAVSDAVKRDMAAKGIPAHKLRTVRNRTIGGKRRTFEPTSQRDLAHPSIATVCGLHSRKGVADLIDAFSSTAREFPQAHLYIVGNGPQAAELRARADATSCREHIHWLGYQRDPREVLASTDIFVLASHSDPCPLVISEARQMGCAIVATDVDGIPELLSFGEKGLLVPPRDPAALSTALSTLLRDTTLRDHYAAAARANLEECRIEEMSRETTAVYRELLPV